MSKVEIQWLDADGAGRGKSESGERVKVHGAFPGDIVSAKGDVIHQVNPEGRREAPCAQDGHCGNCDFGSVSPARQAELKQAALKRAFRVDFEPDFIASPRQSAYRARLKLRIQDGALGYHAPRSHRFVPIDHCPVGRPELQPLLRSLSQWLAEHPDVPLTEVELRTNGTRAVVSLSSKKKQLKSNTFDHLAIDHIAFNGRPLRGDPTLTLDVLGLTLQASPLSFFQVNLEVNQIMAALVRDAAVSLGVERVLDLYSGMGNFSLPLAQAGLPVLAVERTGQATNDLKNNAKTNGLAHLIAVKSCPVERFDPSSQAFDCAVLDPPRAGAPGIIQKLLLTRPKALIYMSCFAPTAARDLQPALKAGYKLKKLVAIDLFPDTHHVESFAVLTR